MKSLQMSSWSLLQLKEGLYSNVSGGHVTCLNNGIYVKKWVALYLESSMIEPLQLSLLLFTVRSLCSFISCRESVEGIIKKTWQFSERLNIMQSRFCHSKQITQFLCFSRPLCSWTLLLSGSLTFLGENSRCLTVKLLQSLRICILIF